VLSSLMDVDTYDVALTTYEMVNSANYYFSRVHWRHVVLDEGHRIKNEETLVSAWHGTWSPHMK
jgi:SNF2 family DNA or RNA helicase